MTTRRWIPSSLEEMVTPESAALVMWDFQVGLAGRASNLEKIVATASRLLAAADRAGVPVIWSRHALPAYPQLGASTLYRIMKRQGVSKPEELRPFMQKGSPEWEFVPQLRPRSHDFVIEKSTPSFFVGTPLQLRLTALQITTLVFAGVATEMGIDLSAKHASALGYFPVVVEDAVGSFTDERRASGLEALRVWIPVMKADEVIESWNAGIDTGAGHSQERRDLTQGQRRRVG